MGPDNKINLGSLSERQLRTNLIGCIYSILYKSSEEDSVSYSQASIDFNYLIETYFWTPPIRPLYYDEAMCNFSSAANEEEFYNFRKVVETIPDDELNANFEFKELIEEFRQSFKKIIELKNEECPDSVSLASNIDKIIWALAEKLYSNDFYMEQKFVAIS